MALAVLTSGCGIALQASSFKVKFREFQEKPKVIDCKYGDLERGPHCTGLTTVDYEWMLRELKAACLALRGSREECWVEK